MTEGTLGVAIVAFNSADVIIACLDSLVASRDARLRIVVTDNASTDDTVALVRAWAARSGLGFAERPADMPGAPTAELTLLRSDHNGGYAYGVNAGVRALMRDPALDLFWVLNPDCIADPDTAARYLAHGADGNFALMSGRTLYDGAEAAVQTDGGRVNRWTGVCSSVNAGLDPAGAPLPDAAALDYLTGANIVASRRFVERAGLMPEDYFLYYEEVDWAWRRGDLPLRIVPDAIVRHVGGTAIGSGSTTRRASAFANYFNYRNRIRFLRRHRPLAVPSAVAWALAKAAQLAAQGARGEARAVIAGTLGLAPPPGVRDRIAPGEARARAFAPFSP